MKDNRSHLLSDLKSDIIKRIKGKVVVVGIGNIMRGDDGLGPKFIELLKAKSVKAHLIDCGTAPENYIIPILSTSCDTVIMVDAADLGIEPGSARILDLNEISKVSFSTHNPSPRLFTDLLKTGKEDVNIFFVCVQPIDTKIGDGLSSRVLQGLDTLADIFAQVLA